MARQKNDGRGRLGGRTKGTPNKVTTSLREFLVDIIDQNRDNIAKDLARLEDFPAQRLAIMERLMAYVIPKQTASNVAVDIDTLNEEQINELINRIYSDDKDKK